MGQQAPQERRIAQKYAKQTEREHHFPAAGT
jgi:hypothetical protein